MRAHGAHSARGSPYATCFFDSLLQPDPFSLLLTQSLWPHRGKDFACSRPCTLGPFQQRRRGKQHRRWLAITNARRPRAGRRRAASPPRAPDYRLVELTGGPVPVARCRRRRILRRRRRLRLARLSGSRGRLLSRRRLPFCWLACVANEHHAGAPGAGNRHTNAGRKRIMRHGALKADGVSRLSAVLWGQKVSNVLCFQQKKNKSAVQATFT